MSATDGQYGYRKGDQQIGRERRTVGLEPVDLKIETLAGQEIAG